MNKRITSLMLVFTLILTMLATAVPALAAPPASSCTYSIEADKTSANPGDTINFTIYMQQTGNQNTLEGTLVIPDGLTFVTGSGKLEDGIKTTLGWDSVEWTPVPKDWEELLQAFNRTYPDFRERLKRKIPKLSEQEWRMCCLIKMEVPPSTAAMLLCCTNQAISMRRVRLYQKITGEKGTPELCDSFIRDF